MPTTPLLGANAETNRQMFLDLFVTQLQNQNPLEPMDNSEFMSQLSQLTSMEQLTNMNTTMQQMGSNFAAVLQMTEMSLANSLIGRVVSFTEPETGQTITDTVDAVHIVGQDVWLEVGEHAIEAGAITAVHDAAAPPDGGSENES